MFEHLDYDDSESPTIGFVPSGASWDEVYDHIKIAHSPLLVRPGDGSEYAGAYWADTRMQVVNDLGADLDEAITDFREYLREQGEAY